MVAAAPVATVTTQLECARRADGGAAVIVCSDRFLARLPQLRARAVSVDGACSGVSVQDKALLSRTLMSSVFHSAGFRPLGLLFTGATLTHPLLDVAACIVYVAQDFADAAVPLPAPFLNRFLECGRSTVCELAFTAWPCRRRRGGGSAVAAGRAGRGRARRLPQRGGRRVCRGGRRPCGHRLLGPLCEAALAGPSSTPYLSLAHWPC